MTSSPADLQDKNCRATNTVTFVKLLHGSRNMLKQKEVINRRSGNTSANIIITITIIIISSSSMKK